MIRPLPFVANVDRDRRQWFKTTKILFSLVSLFLLGSTGVYAQTRTNTYSTAGTYSWTAPCDVTSITVQAWGAGAGGGYARNSSGAAGGGGGGGAYASSVIAVTPGNTYTIVVGLAGVGAINNGSLSTDGGNSTFSTNVVVAEGGFAGSSSSSNAAAAPGLGGSIAGSTGTTRFAGGQGATGVSGTAAGAGGGGGGASAGTAAAGNFTAATVSIAGGTAVAGAGAGGAGSLGANGAAGSGPGGGGAGAHRNSSNTTGGAGADGRVVLTYTSAFVSYCASVPQNLGLNDGISQVIFNTINNTSTVNAGTEYTDFGCTASTSVERGLTYTLSVYVNTGGNNTRTQRAWIDWNQNGSFTDAGETINLSTLTNVTNGLATVSVLVPATATLGATKMRVSSSNSSAPSSCDNNNFTGQVEDYRINVLASTNCTGTPTGATISTSATTGSPSSTFTLTASGYSVGTGITYQWQSSPTGLAGSWSNIVGATTVPSQTITASSTPGNTTYYQLLVTCTPSGLSSGSNSISFITSSNTLNMTTNSTTTYACGSNYTIYDNGGPSSNYPNSNSSGYVVFQNSGDAVITITGTYDIHSSDILVIYNGTTYTAANQTWYSNTVPTNNGYTGTGTISFVSAPGQPVTIRFQASNAQNAPGFALNVSYSGNCSATTVYCVPPHLGMSGYRYYFTTVEFAGTLNDVSNNSTYSTNGYQDFTGLSSQAVQEAGEGINVKYQVNAYRGQIKAWVDWNRNNIFDEPSETVYDPTGVLTQTGTFGFTIPTGTSPGNYRMRIRTVNNYDFSTASYPTAYPTLSPCGLLVNGETEDYLFTVIPRCDARIATVTGAYKCSNTATTMVLSATGTSGVTGFNWYAAETGGTPLNATPTASFTTPAISSTTTYWVTALNGTCETPVRVSVTAEIRSVPDITFSPANPSLCESASLNVTGGNSTPETIDLINEGFEGGALGTFTVTNTTLGTTPAITSMQWQNRTSTYIPTANSVWKPAISSGFGTNRFAMANADLSGWGASSTTNAMTTTLASPAVNTNTYTSLTLTLRAYYSHYLSDGNTTINDYFDVLVSTDGGTNWTTLQAFSADQGNGTNFTTLTYNMNSYVNQTNLKVGVRFRAWWVDGVAVDDIKLTGTKPPTSNFTWQQLDAITYAPVLPIDNLYTALPAGPGTLYVSGTPAANVFVSPTAAQQTAGDPLPFIASLTFSNGCVAKDTIRVSIDDKVWIGNTTDWHTASNWCGNVVPTLSNRVRIPTSPTGGNMPIISSGNTGLSRTLTVESGASVTVNSGGTLQLRLDLKTLAGSTFTNNGTLELVGNEASAAQNFPGAGTIAQMNNLTINNTTASPPAGRHVVLNAPISIRGELKPTSGNLYLGNYDITLKSTATATANVSAVQSAANITYGTGRFVVERYISYTRKWQLLSVPANTTQSIRESWQNAGVYSAGWGVNITGPVVANGIDAYSSMPSMKYQVGCSQLFTPVTNTNAANSLLYPKGYYVFVYGDRSATANSAAGPATTLRTRGSLYVGNGSADQPPAVSATASTAATGDDHMSVGNPFVSPINFASIRGASVNSSGNFKDNFKVWDPSQPGLWEAGIYQTITGVTAGLATPGGGSIYNSAVTSYNDIQSGQAFYVEATIPGTVSVAFNESMKSSTQRLANRGEENRDPYSISMISAFIHHGTTGVLLDGNRAVLDNQYSDNIDEFDAGKLWNEGANFGIYKHNTSLAVEARPTLHVNDTIQYEMYGIDAGVYEMRLAMQQVVAVGLQGFLVDRFNNSETPISIADSNFIPFTVTGDPASQAADRFLLVFKAATVTPVRFISVDASRQADRSIAVKWRVANETNIVRYEVERSPNGQQFSGILQTDAINSSSYTKTDIAPLADDNYYRIKAIGIGGEAIYSQMVKVAPDRSAPQILVTPNPVKDKMLQVRFVNQAAGNYQVQISNTVGQVVYTGTINISAASQLEAITLNSSTASGSYQVAIRNSGGKIIHSERILIE